MAPPPATKTIRLRPLSGWALDQLITLDAAHPGILRFAHQASPLRRQAIFFTLSHLYSTSAEDLAARLRRPELSVSSDPLVTISVALMNLRVRDIVQALHPGVQGLFGALKRMSDSPLPPPRYRALVRMLSDPDLRHAKVLRQIPLITETTLTVLRIVEPSLLFPDLMRRFPTTKDAEGFVAAVALIRRIVPGVTDAALVASLRALAPTSRLDQWAQRWLARAVFPLLPPIQDDEEWQVLRTGKAMQHAAARFRNCLRDKVAVCAVGRAAFIEWGHSGSCVMIELTAFTGPGGGPHWALEGIYGPRNSHVDGEVAQAICRKLQNTGILLPAKLGHARRNNRAAPLLNVYDFGGMGLPDADVEAVEAYIDEIIREVAA